ncbi:hypothetical protein GCM10027416_16790 [Okibacterium endophyticum]
MSATYRRIVRGVAAFAGMALLISGSVAVNAPAAQAEPGTVHAPVSGAGSTWSSNAIDQWVSNVWNNYKWRVTFDKQGSSKGRQLFANGSVDFGVSEIPYALTGSDAVDPRPSRPLAYMPIVAGGTAFMYNLVIGGKRVTNLRLSGEVITKIFTNVITSWDNPEIAADNPGLTLPSIPIIPVVRSDGSGTSAQFSTWMRSQHGGLWQDFCNRIGKANCGITSNYPIPPGSRFQGKNGSEGVSGFVAQAHAAGAITYVEYSYALNSRFPVAKVLNAADYYTEPTAQNVAVGLLGAGINEDQSSPDYLTQQLDGVFTNPDPRAYPLSSYSYMILPTDIPASGPGSNFSLNKGLTLADFAAYFLCEGQQQAEQLGYSPLPINLVEAGQAQIQKIPGGNPTIQGISACNNPTFSPDGGNRLAQTAPQPQACDKRGPTQCTTGTGGLREQETDSSGGNGGNGSGGNSSGGSGSGGDGSGASGGDGSGGSGTDVLDGDLAADDGAPVIVAGSPTAISADGIPINVLMIAGGLLLIVAFLVPPFLSRLRRGALTGRAGGSSPPTH